MSALIRCLSGQFIVFDGPDGAGKTLLAEGFLKYLDDNGVRAMRVREPGGTHYGESIRHVLLEDKHLTEKMSPHTEMLLFMAARVQLLREVVMPALSNGITVLSDRFVSSTLAYQGAMGVPWDEILAVAKIVIPAQYWPACTVILDLPLSLAKQRRAAKPAALDRIEERDDAFQRKVRLNYVKQAAVYEEFTTLVDASGTADDTFNATVLALTEFFDRRKSTPIAP